MTNIESYVEDGVQGSVRILAEVFNMAAALNAGGTQMGPPKMQGIVDSASGLLNKMSPDLNTISLLPDDQTYLMLQFMKIGQKSGSFRHSPQPDAIPTQMLARATALFDGAVEKNIIKPASPGFECR